MFILDIYIPSVSLSSLFSLETEGKSRLDLRTQSKEDGGGDCRVGKGEKGNILKREKHQKIKNTKGNIR